MNPDFVKYYQELVNLISPGNDESWKSFLLEATMDETGLGLSLTYIFEDHEEDSSDLPVEVFYVIEALQEATPPEHAWVKWAFSYHREGRYDINVTYGQPEPVAED